MHLAALLLASLPLLAEGPAAPRLVEWERGVAVEPRGHPDRAMFLWFYEWNMFEAMSAGQHTQGTYKLARKIAPDGSSATITGPGLRLDMKAVQDGAELTLEVTNLTAHDWPAVAGIIPCWNPGQRPGTDPSQRVPLNPIFADPERDKTFFVSPRGLQPLTSRAIHFNQDLRPLLDRISPQGTFVFSEKWPTSDDNAATGILIRESADGKWVTGIGWEDYLSVQGHNPWSCMHAAIRVGPLQRNEKKTVRGRIYLFPGTRTDCLTKWRSAFPGVNRDLAFFLRRLRTLEHLPELEASHTAMASTWDRSGANRDGVDFKQVIGNRNVLLDVDGPGCVHRIFTGRLGARVAGTRLQVLLDEKPEPVFDLEVDRFFDDKNGPLPYPLVFHKTYPGTLFPIPFARHCLIQLVSPEPDAAKRRWGNFWQVTYTTYPPGTRVRTLQWPLRREDQEEVQAVCKAWLAAESASPAPPASWTVQRRLTIPPGGAATVPVDGRGVIRELRVATSPATPESLRAVRFQMAWDGASSPSVDVPLGYFFGHADYGHRPDARFSSLLLGVTNTEAWCRFPMPFDKGAILRFVNASREGAVGLLLRLDITRLRELPGNWGRFHATWTETPADGEGLERARRYGTGQVPVHLALERAAGPGKYVGLLLHVAWPYPSWWGEGDWLIWTDEDAWPPSYHGTGSEEYFNSGWCEFDRKAVSGFVVKDRPGHVAVYTFHLNDAFQFRRNVRVADEIWKRPEERGLWGSTAYWYALTPQPAGSRVEYSRVASP